MTTDSRITSKRNILLAGRPRIGKTTVMMRLMDLLQHLKLGGFYTEEIRVGGRRVGFQAATLTGQTCVLAHVDLNIKPRVGKYGVDIAAFEKLVIPELSRAIDLMLIDEIGKMECFSAGFVSAVRNILDASIPLVATVAVAGGGLIAEVKDRADVEIVEVTLQNRDGLPDCLGDMLARYVTGRG